MYNTTNILQKHYNFLFYLIFTIFVQKIHLQNKSSVFVAIKGCCKLCHVFPEYCHIRWWTVENVFGSRDCILFEEKGQVCIWSVKMMPIPCINIAHRWILFEKVHDYWKWSSLTKVYTGVEQAESLIVQVHLLVHEVLGCAAAIIVTIFFCKF